MPTIIVSPNQPVSVEARTGPPGPRGPAGPPGTPGPWVSMTQAEFEALVVKDPTTLYVIIG